MPTLRRTLAGLLLFGFSFGYLEASVVVYLRHLYAPLQHELMPGKQMNDIFPLVDAALLQSHAPWATRLIVIEVGREAATIIMLASVALLVTRVRGAWLAAFAVAFGAWDITFYGALKLLIDWPASLATWDLLFLIPVPWVGPVWSPVAVSISLIVCGGMALATYVPFRPRHWIGMLGGGAVILYAFMVDYRAIMDGALPGHFPWLIFWIGELLGIAAFLDAWRRRPRDTKEPAAQGL